MNDRANINEGFCTTRAAENETIFTKHTFCPSHLNSKWFCYLPVKCTFVLVVLWVSRRGWHRTEGTHSFQHLSVLVDFHSMWNSMNWSVIFPQKSIALPRSYYHVSLTKNSGLVEFVFCLEYRWQEKAIEDFSYLRLPSNSQKTPHCLHWQLNMERGVNPEFICKVKGEKQRSRLAIWSF